MAFRRTEGTLPIFFIIILRITYSTSETCTKIDTCSCKFENRSTVSLKAVDGTSSTPSFTGISGEAGTGRTFSWNPCTPFTTKAAGCSDVMVCQIASPNQPAGTKDTSFSVDSAGNVVISYGSIEGSDQHTRETKITLKCDRNQAGKGTKPSFTESLNPAKTSSVYSGTFTSNHSCSTGGSSSSGGLSVGSILLIIFFPLLIMYVIIGVLINRFGRGIESMPELLPNYSFWAGLPSLVKDGVVFTCGCIKSTCSSLSRKCGKDGYAEI